MKDTDPIVLKLADPIEPPDVPRLCAELAEQLGARASPGHVVVDVAALTRPGLAAVDALARLHLTARRLGHPLAVRNAGPQLLALLALVGLTELVSPPDGPAGRTTGTSASRPGTT
ncbi:STAS domain-containing protein [Streptomyces coeruleoprunus]|uniref:STAS domain-containing protein n=1 Tax=Streptomyces coeruleoprunus TaxID=285563 RepID=A0ABV9XMB7_9ACTN